MKKSFFLNFVVALSVLVSFIDIVFLAGCKCRTCTDQEEATVPLEVLAKADSFITETTGREFFQKYITADFFRTKLTPPYYELAYKLFMPEKPFVNVTIRFTVDSLGNVMKDRDIIGIPRCENHPDECNFNIDEETARLIATEMKLKEGVREWDAVFLWDLKLQKYVWKILSTLTESGEEENYKASGQEIVIDPNTGEVLALNNWNLN